MRGRDYRRRTWEADGEICVFGGKIPRNLPLQTGTRIGHYDIQAPLGAGGMGEVYRARDTRLGRDVALKVLPDSFAADPERIARIEREAQILAALSHANIATIHGLEISGPTRVLVMQLVDGESLEARLKRGPLPLEEAIAIAKQIGDALGAAHERGIVHRDLKPGNIMLTPDGGVKVLDFGLARMVEPEAAPSSLSMSPTLSIQATMAGTILGTAPYMSPEQARGWAVDKRTDIWAFGCVLFEMLAGTRAFEGTDIADTIAAIMRGDPNWQLLPASLPSNVSSTLRGCLTKEPRQRFADIAVPIYLLVTAREPVPASPVAAVSIPRWRRALPTLAAVLLAILVTGAVSWIAHPSPAPAPLSRFVLALPEGTTLTSLGRQAIATSPDGRRIVYVANQRLYLRDLDNDDANVIRGTDGFTGNLGSPVFSPDGSEIAFWVADDASIKRVPVTGGTALTITRAANPLGLRWEDEGLVFGQTGGAASVLDRAVRGANEPLAQGIVRVPISGGTPELLIPGNADEVLSVGDTLPGGRGRLYWVKKRGDVWDSGTVKARTPNGEDRILVRGGSDGRYDGNGHLLYAVAGIVMAIPFDLDRLEVTGRAAPVLEGVAHPLVGTTSGIAQYSLSSNGMLVYGPGPVESTDENASYRLATFDDKGTVEPLKLPLGTYRGIRVSPDGKTVAYESGTPTEFDIWLQALDLKTAARRLTFGGTGNAGTVWSPDSQWIAFTSNRDGPRSTIYKQRADGTGVAERLAKPDGDRVLDYLPLSWSPDGASLLVTARRKDDRFDLLVLSLKDGRLSPFSGVSGLTIGPEAVFSPDGRWVVYQRNGTGNIDVQSFVEPFPATGAKYLVPITRAGHPFWSRRGDRLYFNTSSLTSMQVDVRTTPAVTFSSPRPLARGGRNEPNPLNQRRNVDTLPDGRLLGVMLDTGRAALDKPEIHVVLNWLPSLAAKLGR